MKKKIFQKYLDIYVCTLLICSRIKVNRYVGLYFINWQTFIQLLDSTGDGGVDYEGGRVTT